MDAKAAKKPAIDRKKCIRCFCCQEACPHNAISVRPGWLLRLASVFRKR
jgi:formate hydrogenlyase subunit 6/NADH:ubiquinone oxidoreductase subunit I